MKTTLILMLLSFGVYAEQISHRDAINTVRNNLSAQRHILDRLETKYSTAIDEHKSIIERTNNAREELIRAWEKRNTAWEDYNTARYVLAKHSPELQQFKRYEFLKAQDELNIAEDNYNMVWDERERHTPTLEQLGEEYMNAREIYVHLLGELQQIEDSHLAEVAEAETL